MSRSPHQARAPQPRKAEPRPVSRPHEPEEREADRAAEVVARGGSVAGWSFASVPASAPIQRQEKPKTDEEKKKEALTKAGEAALETPQGKALKEKVLDDPLVRTVKDAVTSTPGLIATGTVLAGGVAGLAATGKELPFQPPEIPLDRITPGLSGKVTYQGPVNAPTFVGLTITYKEQGPKGKGKGAAQKESFAAETARIRAEQQAFGRKAVAPGSKEAEEQRRSDEAIAYVVAQQSGRFGPAPPLTIPLTPTEPKPEEKQEEQEKQPVQRAPASSSSARPAHAHVGDALSAPGRPLDAPARRSMEALFGQDFSRVRVHDDARAASAAARVDAAAFTVGDDLVFGAGRYDAAGLAGRRLLAHELAHVVQQRAGSARLQRKAEPAISAPSDPAEREADEVAERVLAGLPARDAGAAPPSGIARQESDGEAPEEEELVWPELEDEAEAESEVRASRDSGPSVAPRGFSRSLAASGAGEALPGPERRTLERGLGTSFAHVRLHRDSVSDRLARSIGAQAFTAGPRIFLAAGAPAGGREGLRLLAHELAHVRQHEASGRRDGTVRRQRALYFSTHGKQGYFQYAQRFHRDRGFPAPMRVSSVEELLENLVTLPRPIHSVRLVTHAVPAGIFLPLLRGGSTSLFAQDLKLQTQEGLERELETEHLTVRTRRGDDPGAFAVQEVAHHVVSRTWVAPAYARVAAAADGARFLRSRRFPGSVAPGGDLETLMWWILDRELIQAQRERPDRRGRLRLVHVFPGIPAPRRAAAAQSLDRNAGIYRERARDHLLARGYPQRGTPEERRAGATEAVAEFERRLLAVTPALIDHQLAGGAQFQFADPSPRYETVQGALERGTFSNNVLFAKVAIRNGMPFEIRGCRIGQNVGWLESFRDFWGMGAGTTRRRPDVSAPDLRHVYGLRRGNSSEWLQAPRGRIIRGDTPEFDTHIVHAR